LLSTTTLRLLKKSILTPSHQGVSDR
jgi:hypothetical protein